MNPLDLVKHHTSVKKENDDFSYVGFSLAGVMLEHRRYNEAMAAIARLHVHRQKNNEGRGLLIVGPSGVGKSTLLKNYVSHFESYVTNTSTVIPVLLITCPGAITVDRVLNAIYDALNYRVTSKPDFIKLCKLIKLYKVEMILFDEFQHTYYAKDQAVFRQLIDTLKNLITSTNVACVFAGLQQALVVIETSEQIKRRFTEKIQLARFSLEEEADFDEFRAILNVYQEALPLKTNTPLIEKNLARRFLYATDGILDFLCKLLEKSVYIASSAGISLLDDVVYSAAFKELIWKDCPNKLNPFDPSFLVRPLRERGEPFYPWDLKHAIGSPLAKRNIILPQGATK